MNKDTSKKDLVDILLDNILEMNDAEVDGVFEEMNLSVDDELQNLKNIYSEANLQVKKNTLLSARKKIDALKKENSLEVNHEVTNIKEKLSNMMIKGLLPAELTMAFRDGKNITDEEALSIYEDLIELGLNMNDE